jgi:hypothetical protein
MVSVAYFASEISGVSFQPIKTTRFRVMPKEIGNLIG